MRIIQRFDRLPFYAGAQRAPRLSADLPDHLPFQLAVELRTGTIVQASSVAVHAVLARAYAIDDLYLTMPMDQSTLTGWRRQEFEHALGRACVESLVGRVVYEIGCGTGAFLELLRRRGARVAGCEPGPSAEVARERYGLPVIRSPFDPAAIPEVPNLVVLMSVLEHIDDPGVMLAQIAGILGPGDQIFLSVPDSAPQLISGDPGMLVHEHWNYFTEASLRRQLEVAGFGEVGCWVTSHNLLYAWGRRTGRSRSPTGDDALLAERYVERLTRASARVRAWVSSARQAGERAAFYGASVGAANLWSLLDLEGQGIRMYDGEPAKHGRFLPGCSEPIRSPAQLLTDAPGRVLILPLSFGETIRQFLWSELQLPASKVIDTLADLLREGA